MRLRKVIAVAATGAFLSVASPSSLASPVNYDESIDGDLPTTTPWETTLLYLALGNNRIAGGTTYSTDLIDEDYFGFLVPEGGKVVSISLRYTFPYELYTTRGINLADRTDLTGTWIENSYVQINGGNAYDTPSPSDFFVASWPLMSSGTSWSIAMAGAAWVLPGGTMNYEWRIDVRPNAVPEPSTLALLGIGVAGLAAIRRRNASR